MKHIIGEYKINSEDTSKVYVEAKNGTETTSFFLNSTLISKIAPDSIGDYENIELTAPVTAVDGKLYINSEGFMQGFNAIFAYDKAENRIDIQTLPYLINYYKTNIKDYGYDALSEDFNNQKALIYGMIVASKESTGKFGVVNARSGEELISPRYNAIEFIESAREFIITNTNNKMGIAHASGATKINVLYDDIEVLDSSLKYYLVKSNEKYGVINSNEERVIYIEYDQIGIDTSEFQADQIKSQYVLYDKVIPVCLNNKWGLFDLSGNKVTEVEYDEIGCINDGLTDRVVNNALAIGDSEVIIVSKDNLYGGVSTKGDLLIPIIFKYMYSLTSSGETTYYMTYNDTDYLAIDYINIMKKKLGYEEDEEENVNDEKNNSSDTNTTVNDNENQADINQTNETNTENIENTNTENNNVE